MTPSLSLCALLVAQHIAGYLSWSPPVQLPETLLVFVLGMFVTQCSPCRSAPSCLHDTLLATQNFPDHSHKNSRQPDTLLATRSPLGINRRPPCYSVHSLSIEPSCLLGTLLATRDFSDHSHHTGPLTYLLLIARCPPGRPLLSALLAALCHLSFHAIDGVFGYGSVDTKGLKHKNYE